MHQLLSGPAAADLSNNINLISDSGWYLLLSAANRTLVVPHTQNSFGDGSFTPAYLHTWNSLPLYLCNRISAVDNSARLLKHFCLVVNDGTSSPVAYLCLSSLLLTYLRLTKKLLFVRLLHGCYSLISFLNKMICQNFNNKSTSKRSGFYGPPCISTVKL